MAPAVPRTIHADESPNLQTERRIIILTLRENGLQIDALQNLKIYNIFTEFKRVFQKLLKTCQKLSTDLIKTSQIGPSVSSNDNTGKCLCEEMHMAFKKYSKVL